MDDSPSDAVRNRNKADADLNAVYARRLGRNPFQADNQEELLRDARLWAEAASEKLVPSIRDVQELRKQVVKQTWDEFVSRHRHRSDFQLSYGEFGSALWEEGEPSLADFATAALQKLRASTGVPPPASTRRSRASKTSRKTRVAKSALERMQTAGKGAKTSMRRGLFQSLSPDDPNYEIARRFYFEAWADSHRLVADGFAGRISLSDFVEGCVRTFSQGAQLHIAFADANSVPEICREIDRMAKQFIRKFNRSLSSAPKSIGKRNLTRAMGEFSRRINETASRSKQEMMEKQLNHGTDEPTKPVADQQSAPYDGVSSGLEVGLPQRPTLALLSLRDRLNRGQISPADGLKELSAIGNDPRYPIDLRASILSEVSHVSGRPSDVNEPSVEALSAMLDQPSLKLRREAMTILIDRILDPQEIKDYEAARRHAQRAEKSAQKHNEPTPPLVETGLVGLPGAPLEIHSLTIPSAEKVFPQVIVQQMKFFELRHTLPETSEDVKADFRGLAHAAIVAATFGSSVPQAQVDDWIDALGYHSYVWKSMADLVRSSRDHLRDLHRQQLAVGSLEKASRLSALVREFDDLLKRVLTPTPASISSKAQPAEEDRGLRKDREIAERAARRQAVVMPILKRKRWKPGRLATEAGVAKNSVYQYLDGTRARISDENRAAIAHALEIKPEELPV